MSPRRWASALFAGAAVGCLATSHGPLAWFLVLPAGLSLVWRFQRVPESVVALGRSLAWIFLITTFLLRWLRMLFPILPAGTAAGLTLVLGYGLAMLACLFLLGERVWPRTYLYATVSGVLVVASFGGSPPVDPFLVIAGGAVFLELAGPRVQAAKPLVGAAVAALLAFSVALGIIWILPPAQGQVEQVLVGVIVPQHESAVGLSPHARLGGLERLKLSKTVVMRVWSERAQKLRGRVFTRFDGQNWHQSVWRLQGLQEDSGATWLRELPGKAFLVERVGERPVVTKIVEANAISDLLLAPAGTLAVRAPLDGLSVDAARALVPPPSRSARIYGLLHRREVSGAGVGEDQALVEECLQVAPDTDPRVKELAARLAVPGNTLAQVERTVQYLQSNYHYSLEVGTFRSKQPLAEFLFEKKKGYCEYFASAAVVLLRLQGVPARYVSGLNVLPEQKQGDHYVVRESDAHAWVEAYVPDRGWMEADPTPAAEYEALHADLGQGWLDEKIEAAKAWWAELRAELHHRSWREILDRLPAVWIAAAVLVMVVWRKRRRLSFRWKRPREKAARAEVPPEIEALFRALERAWERAGHPRPRARPPLEHLSHLPGDRLQEASRRIVECYYRVRFRGDRVPPEEIAALKATLRG